MIVTEGDHNTAGLWIGYAKARMKRLVDSLINKRGTVYERIAIDGVEIRLAVVSGTQIIRIKAEGGKVLILAHMGRATYEHVPMFYGRSGAPVERPNDWSLLDDGRYHPVFFDADGNLILHDNPYLYEYDYSFGQNGMGVPSNFCGIAARKDIGEKSARYILNQAMEDEMYSAYTSNPLYLGPGETAMQLSLEDTLIGKMYWAKGKPWVSRYCEDGIVHIPTIWGGAGFTLFLDSVQTANFGDKIPRVPAIWKHPFDGPVSYVSTVSDGGDRCAVAATNYYASGQGLSQDIVRGMLYEYVPGWGYTDLDPFRAEEYLFSGAAIPGDTFARDADAGGPYDAFWIQPQFRSGQQLDVDPATLNEIQKWADTGMSTISNYVERIYRISDTGAKTCVSIEKDTDMLDPKDYATVTRSRVFLNNVAVDDTGELPIEILYDSDPLPSLKDHDWPGPFVLRKANFQILHAHNEKNFQAALYRKTTYIVHSNELLPYKCRRLRTITVMGGFDSDYKHCQVRKTSVQFSTTFHLVVNGVKHDLPWTSTGVEHILSIVGEDYLGPAIPTVDQIEVTPWCDITPESESVNITRIFSSEAGDFLLFSFDVFPCSFQHRLILTGNNVLIPKFVTPAGTYPDSNENEPASDYWYASPKERKWLIYNNDGTLKYDVKAPKGSVVYHPTPVNFEETGSHVNRNNRVNGIMLLEVR